MKTTGKSAGEASVGKRTCRVLGLSLLLSLPCFLINLAVQGGKEFRQEIAASRKYRKILKKMKREDR